MPEKYLLIAAVIVLIAAAFMFYKGLKSQRESQSVLKGLEDEKERLRRETETRQKELALEAREEAHRLRDEIEQDYKEQRTELQRLERKLAQKEETLEEKLSGLDKQWDAVRMRERETERHYQEILELKGQQRSELQRISGLSAEEARVLLFKEIEDQSRLEAARLMHQIEEDARNEAEKRARDILTMSIQRIAADHVSETTVSVVPLPSDDVKGRIIGREGRNIRAFETMTGVDVIIDDTPEAVVLSSFDPVRREVARLALEALVVDGRIHPGRIEETVARAQEEVDAMIKHAGERAVMESGVTGLHPEIIKLLGRMHYRTSYGQNLLDHSIEVCLIAGSIAAELGVNSAIAKRAALMHDLGKIVPDAEGPHAILSQEIMLRYGESPAVARAAGAHHNDIPVETVEDVIVQLADTVSASRPGARREMLENYVKRLQKLETIADSFPGVDKTYAVQAGREIRLIVRPEVIDDASAHILARDAAKRIEEEMEFPGQIKVTVIRETRAIDYAK